MTKSYRLNDGLSFRISSADSVDVIFLRRQTHLSIPAELWQLLPELRTPITAATLHERCTTDATIGELAALLDDLVRLDVLTVERPQLPPSSLERMLRSDVRDDAAALEAIGMQLRAGRMIVIPDALPAELAERVHDSLAGSTDWQPFEGHFPNFSFRHHNLFETYRYPDALREATAIFEDPATRAFVERLSGEPCSGEVALGASWYQPGDHSLPHTDAGQARSVAFIWHLTKDWNPRWGGQLVWCPNGTALQPRFNWLTLFRVTPSSLHFVAPVAPGCGAKRLAVNGWWCRPARPRTDEALTDSTTEDIAVLGHYGEPRQAIGAAGVVYIV